MNPNLVCPTSVQSALDQTAKIVPRQKMYICSSWLSCMYGHIHYRHTQTVPGVTTNWCINRTVSNPLPRTVRQSQVLAAYFAISNQANQSIHGMAAACNHHEAAGIFIQTVNNARTRQRGGPGIARQQAIEQCPAPIAWRGMYHQPCGLVKNQQMVVFIHDLKIHGFGTKSLTLQSLTHFDTNHIPSLDTLCGFGSNLTVQTDGTLCQQLLKIVAGKLGNRIGQRSIQPLSMLCNPDVQSADFYMLSSARIDFGELINVVLCHPKTLRLI